MPIQYLCTVLLALAFCASQAVAASAIPADVDAALARAKIPREAVALWVQEAGSTAPARLSHRAHEAMNPASVIKLTTTYAALDLLGQAYTWTTPVWVDGTVRNGTLQGTVYIQGQGDPKLVIERLWLLLRRLQGLGIQRIAGDIVLDRSAWDIPERDPGQFDGEPLRPYNAAPDALLINLKTVAMTFTPERSSNIATVQFDPPLHGVQMQATVPLNDADCGDYRTPLKADFSDANAIRFAGSYAASCGEKMWPVAYIDPRSYAPRAVQGLWLAMGGQLSGSVRYGPVPATVANRKPTLEMASVPLAEVVRDINKFSNNVMAQQVFLSLGRLQNMSPGALPEVVPQPPVGTFAASRVALQRWWRERISAEDMPVWDNGAGLSRDERISAQGLGRMLQVAYRSPSMSELMSSMPITGVDGTLRRFKGKAVGSAHLKTGSLSNVLGRAGYVDGASGKRYVLVLFINHPNANAEGARAAVEALVDWTVRDLP